MATPPATAVGANAAKRWRHATPVPSRTIALDKNIASKLQ